MTLKIRNLFFGLAVAVVLTAGTAIAQQSGSANDELYICAISEARECTASAPCKEVELEDIFLSPLIMFDLKNKVIVSAAMDDRGRKEKITGLVRTERDLIVYGHGDDDAWNSIISLKTGRMTGNINNGETNHVLFGHCAPHAYP